MKQKLPMMELSVPPGVHSLYHVCWGKSNGVVGRVKSVDHENKTVIMVSPKTKTVWKTPVKWSDLRHTRRMEQKLKFK